MATIDEVYDDTQEILVLLRQQGFRRDRVSNEQLKEQNQAVLNEIRDLKRMIKAESANA